MLNALLDNEKEVRAGGLIVMTLHERTNVVNTGPLAILKNVILYPFKFFPFNAKFCDFSGM